SGTEHPARILECGPVHVRHCHTPVRSEAKKAMTHCTHYKRTPLLFAAQLLGWTKQATKRNDLLPGDAWDTQRSINVVKTAPRPRSPGCVLFPGLDAFSGLFIVN